MKVLLVLLVLIFCSIGINARSPLKVENNSSGRHLATLGQKLFPHSHYWKEIGSNGGGGECAGCTIVITLLDNLSEVNSQPIDQLMAEICQYFPAEFDGICVYFVETYGSDIINLLAKNFNADQVCHKINFCTDPTCGLHTQQGRRVQVPSTPANTGSKTFKLNRKSTIKSPWDWIMELINHFAQDHDPVEDIDNDLFSVIKDFRGSSWRGKDCDDIDRNVYPGRAFANTTNPKLDHNCNGIYGINPATGRSYEDELCTGTNAMGTIVLGDSGGAHFEIPPSYMNASQINKKTYSDLLFRLSNEFDLPQLSGYTGYLPSTPGVPVSSAYLNMRARNLCNHRDYQNLAVNGARSGDMHKFIPSVARKQNTDKPALLFLELIGNDVCSPHHDFDHMTTVADFKTNILNALTALDQVLPAGSHVVTVGLAEGTVLWDVLHDRYHPIGVKYPQVYDFLNCLEVSPCWVWMNSNETIRNIGQQRANELNKVYPEIIANYKWKNFDVAYYDFPFKEIVAIWEKQGGQIWELIEPIDGFHPNQIAHALTADYFWGILTNDHPDFVSKANPNNAKILQLFGNQGGY